MSTKPTTTMNSAFPLLHGWQRPLCLPQSRASVVAAIYDDLSDGLRAKEALNRLQCSMACPVTTNTSAWSFEQLERLDAGSQASQVAAEAEMIVIAAHAGLPLAGHVRQWLIACLAARPSREPVLVALDGGGTGYLQYAGQERGLRFSIRELASNWGAKFMNNEEFEQQVNPASAAQKAAGQPLSSLASKLAGARTALRVPRHYGIND